MNIAKETPPEQAAAVLNDLAREFCQYSSPANAVIECLPYGTIVEEHRQHGLLVQLPTGQRLRVFLQKSGNTGSHSGGPGFDHYAASADELGGER
jgi:hypothetical protein